MFELKTNRDLYLAINELSDSNDHCSRTLEQYLLSLLSESQRYCDREQISVKDFFGLLTSSFKVPVPIFDNRWRQKYDRLLNDLEGYSRFRATLIRQIVDLRELEEKGTVNNQLRYFGVNSPRGSRWYNFDIQVYLECAAEGAFGGWGPECETGRQHVPGKVAVLDEEGSKQFVDPEELDQVIVQLSRISWEQAKDFIICGQIYE